MKYKEDFKNWFKKKKSKNILKVKKISLKKTNNWIFKDKLISHYKNNFFQIKAFLFKGVSKIFLEIMLETTEIVSMFKIFFL